MNTIQLFIISIAIFLVHTVLAEDRPEECETLPSELHIIKGELCCAINYHENKLIQNNFMLNIEEFDELGRLQRTCNGDIAVNKCEGACNSQVQPSVITPSGFLKVIIA